MDQLRFQFSLIFGFDLWVIVGCTYLFASDDGVGVGGSSLYLYFYEFL